MIFRFICDNCGETEEIWKQAGEDIPQGNVCVCGEKMRRDWTASIHIPDHMKAYSDDNGFHDHMKYRMKTTRPSGRGKIYY